MDKNKTAKYFNGVWHEYTGLQCRRCRNPVWKSDNPEYSYQCLECDEDLYSFDVEKQERKNKND
jgi:DNA-directed RNA polymerase subunit RPC12/RpoP